MKRHEALVPLSHHHHHALFLALKLKRTGTEKSKLTVEEIKKDVQTFWESEGQDHFREEEEILLPVYAQYASMEESKISVMLLEHIKIRALINQVLHTKQDPVLLMRELGELLDVHVRREEREIFPMIEDALSEDVLRDLAESLHV